MTGCRLNIRRVAREPEEHPCAGWIKDQDYRYIGINRRLRDLHPDIVAETIAGIEAAGGSVERHPRTDLLTINGEFTASLVIVRCRETSAGSLRWNIRFDTSKLTDDEMLEGLKEAFEAQGYLSGLVIDEAEALPSSSAYRSRFGSLLRAYRLVGFNPDARRMVLPLPLVTSTTRWCLGGTGNPRRTLHAL